MRKNPYFQEIFAVNEKQDYVIDAIRALSVLSIIAFHVVVGILQIYDFEKSKEYILSMPAALQPLFHGEKGVDAFFLISGLVLGLPLFKRLPGFDFAATKDFYKKRFFRIYPLFLVALLLYTAGQWSYFGKYFFSNLFLINNLIPGERTIIPVGWSLLVEVQYYAVLPLFLILLKKSNQKLGLLALGVLLSVVACALRLFAHPELYTRPMTDVFLASDHSNFTTLVGEYLYESNLTRFGPFVIGLMLAYLRVARNERLKLLFSNSTAGLLIFIGSILCVGLTAALPIYNPQSFYYQSFSPGLNFLFLATHRQVFASGLGLLILGCWYSPLSIFAGFRSLFKSRFWLPLSRLSFSIYLFHFPFVAIAAVMVFGTTNVKEVLSVSFVQGLILFVLATLLTILFSIPMYVYVERPFIEKGRTKSG